MITQELYWLVSQATHDSYCIIVYYVYHIQFTQQKQVGHIKLMWVASVARTTYPMIVLIIQLITVTISMSNMPVGE